MLCFNITRKKQWHKHSLKTQQILTSYSPIEWTGILRARSSGRTASGPSSSCWFTSFYSKDAPTVLDAWFCSICCLSHRPYISPKVGANLIYSGIDWSVSLYKKFGWSDSLQYPAAELQISDWLKHFKFSSCWLSSSAQDSSAQQVLISIWQGNTTLWLYDWGETSKFTYSLDSWSIGPRLWPSNLLIKMLEVEVEMYDTS